MNKNNLLIATIFALLTACSGDGGGGGTPAPSSSASSGAGTATGPGTTTPAANTRIIDNEDMTAGLKGVDANNNGIRDDIDRLIALKYSATPALKKAAEQKARALQKFMEATTKQQALVAGDDLVRAGDCVYKILPEKSQSQDQIRSLISKEIEALTANTKERFTKYWDSSALAGGSVFEQPAEPVCD